MPAAVSRNDTCPKCGKPVRLAIIEPHLTPGLELHHFECADCGRTKTKTILLNPNRRLLSRQSRASKRTP
jgi:hypothetical protein